MTSRLPKILPLAAALMTAAIGYHAWGQSTSSIDLSGAWKWQAEHNRPNGDQGDTSKGWHAPQFDDSQWTTLRIGANWESQGKHYNGIAWYRKTFDVPDAWRGHKLFLQLGTPDDGAEIYINGTSVGKWRHKEHIRCEVPGELIRSGKPNTIAIRVWDWYMNGGIGGSDFTLKYITPFAHDRTDGQRDAIALGVTDDLPDEPLTSGRWEYGWRDEGLSDTRPKVSVARNAFRGRDAIELNAWYPNSTEFVEYALQEGESGIQWEQIGADYLAFWYRTDDLHGRLVLRLTTNQHRWRHRAQVWQARFPVEPGGWTRVVLPLAAFRNSDISQTHDRADRLRSPRGVRYLVVGHENHLLQNPGRIQLAGFEVGSTANRSPFFTALPLDGLWKFRPDDTRPDGTKSQIIPKDAATNPTDDHRGYGVELGYHSTDLDDRQWSAVQIGKTWHRQGQSHLGPAWYRQQVVVPTSWSGNDLNLKLGTTHDTAVVYWNGEAIGQTTERGEALSVTVPAARVRTDRPNQIAVKVTAWGNDPGLMNGPFTIAPAGGVQLLVAASGKPETAAAPEQFEMGVRPKDVDILVRWRGDASTQPGRLTAHYRLVDCFHRPISDGDLPLQQTGGVWELRVGLASQAARQLYYGEWFRGHVVVTDSDNRVVAVAAFPGEEEANLKLRYDQRDALSLPAIEPIVEDTSYGKLKLVDVIDCAADPDTDPHPYKEGGIRNSWVGLRAYATWKQGVTVESLGDRRYREANNNEFFAYRVGRGKLEPHKAYLLRILVPDDKARYQVMEIKAGRNYQGTGYRSGIAPGHPIADYPQTGELQSYDHIVLNGEKTYGWRGDHTATSEHGFWVVFHDNGRAYSPEYEAGPAAAEIRLYELPDDVSAQPAIRYPKDLPRRVLMMDWERQPEAPPADVARYAQLMGMNAISPVIQKWGFAGFWRSDLGFAPAHFYKTGPEGTDDRDVYQAWLDATRKANVPLVPRIEYGGGPQLPREAWVIGPNGKIDPCGRYCQWGANILHPATWKELKTLADELIGRHIEANPQIAGLLWRQRSDRIKCSYGRRDVQMFCEETGADMPQGNDAQVAKWAANNPDYAKWWQGKRAAFLRKLRDHLKTYRSDLVLYYYNWDPDGWHPGLNPNARNRPQDWSDYYNVDRAHLYAKRRTAARKALSDQYYVDYVQGHREPHWNIYPSLFADDQDIVIFAPVHWRYLADNAPYLRYFQTGDGIGICNQFAYEEKARGNVQGDHYETSELTPGGRDFGMAEEVMAFFHSDANVMTTTTFTYGRGWANEYRRFAQAFLALPDMPGVIVEDAVEPASEDLRVRIYDTDNGLYVSVVSKAMSDKTFEVHLPSDRARTVVDLVSGQQVPSKWIDGQIVFDVSSQAIQLNSYLLQ